MLSFFESLLFFLETIEMNSTLLCNEEMGDLRRPENPINNVDMFVVLFDWYQRFDGRKVDK